MNEKRKYKMDVQKQREFPDRKDLTYWLLILVMLLIFLFVLHQSNPTLVNSKLSLVGTITSIALAIIAIMFSFIQSNSSSNQLKEVAFQTSQIDTNLNKVTEEIKSLQTVKKSIEEYNKVTLSKVNQLENILDEVPQDFSKSTEEDFSKIKNRVLQDIKKISQDDIFATITVKNSNYDLIYNTLIEEFIGVDIHEQVLWKTLFDKGLRLNMEELRTIINKLQQEGKVTIIDNTYVKVNI